MNNSPKLRIAYRVLKKFHFVVQFFFENKGRKAVGAQKFMGSKKRGILGADSIPEEMSSFQKSHDKDIQDGQLITQRQVNICNSRFNL